MSNLLNHSPRLAFAPLLPSLTWRDYVLLAIACVLCCMQVVHPFICDHEIYARGGRVLLDGGHLYKDFIDVKPPLIYELFAGWMYVFGSSAVALRMMDVSLQIVVVVLMFTTLLKYTGSRFIAHGASIAFGAYIASLWLTVLLQPETLAFLPLFLLIRIGAKQSHTTADAIVLGIISCLLFSLKYPLIIPAVAVVWIGMRKSASVWKFLAVVTTSFLLSLVAVFSVVWYDGMIGAAKQIGSFLAGYGAISNSLSDLLSFGLNITTDFVANDTSLLLTVCALAAVIVGMLGGRGRDALLTTTLAVLVGLVFSIILERKFNPTHLSRLVPPMAVLVGYGLPVIWRACSRAWQTRAFPIPTLVAMAMIAVLLSPLPRILRTTVTFVKVAVLGVSWRAATNASTDGIVDLVAMDSALAVTKSLHPRSVVVLGVGGTLMYSFLPNVRTSKFADAHFFTADFAPASWNSDALEEARDAEVVVMQNDDVHPRITGTTLTTRAVLEQRPEWIALFKSRTLLRDDGKWSIWTK